MIIIHLGVYKEQVLLWGEVPVEAEVKPDKSASKGRGRKKSSLLLKTASMAVPFPYNAGVEPLALALKQGGLEILAEKIAEKEAAREMIAWLPAISHEPVASSALIAEPPLLKTSKTSKNEAGLCPWLITTINLAAEEAVELLCTCAGKHTLALGVVVGADLAFWSAAMRLAAALVARQDFLPGLSQNNGRYRALWKPVLTGSQTEALARVAKAMPSVSRALIPIKEAEHQVSPPDIPAISVLSDFLTIIVDYLVRFSKSGPKSNNKSRLSSKGVSKASRSSGTSDFDSVHDQWLHALSSSDGLMEASSEDLAHLAAQINDWQRPISILSGAPFRLCFRLEEPEETSEEGEGKVSIQDWYVRYLLQAVDDPSLLIPAQEAWRTTSKKISLLKDWGAKSKEYMLLSLGQASTISSAIEDSLKTPSPSGYRLNTIAAHEFLTEKAIALEQAGFGVMLPAWWTKKGTKLRLSARAKVETPRMQGGSGLSLDQVIQFDWEVALGEEKLSFQELQELARLKVPLVKIRGQWVQITAEEIQSALDFWKKKAEGRARVRDIIQMALGQMALVANRPSEAITFEGVTATGWVSDLLAQLEGGAPFEELTPALQFQGTLRPYQVRGYSWLGFLRKWGFGACLADDMGLGKTVQTLALIQRDWQESEERRPILLICPTSVVGNWQKEASRFTPDLPVMVHHGLGRAKGVAFRKEAEKKALVISSYSLLHRDIEALKTVSWLGVILDEAQNIKNSETKQAKAARTLAQGSEGGLLPYRVALTGTPVENNVGDLWSIMEFLNSGLLGRLTEFKRSFFIPIQANRDHEATERLKRLTGPFILRRLKTDKTIIDDLPEKMEMKVFCNLTKEQASLYEAVVKEASQDLDSSEGIKRKGIVLSILMKLKQVCNHPTQFLGDNSAIAGRSGKLARLTEMMEEIIEIGDRALIFSQFTEMGHILQRYLQETFGQEVLFLHGSVLKKHRDRMIERFQAEYNGPGIFILSLKAGGTGLNLTRANHVFHFDRWWNPAVENQATDRAFRIGQTKNVQVHKFLCVGTLEEKIDEMIERKKEIAEKVVGTGEGWLTELSTSELKDLFALRQEAVSE